MKLLAEDMFESLEKEDELDIEQFKVRKSEGLDTILKDFKALLEKHPNQIIEYADNAKDWFNISKRRIYFPYEKEDIIAFSLSLDTYKKVDSIQSKAGLYISALIHKSTEDEIILPIGNKSLLFNSIGYKNNGKKIIVKGDVGNHIGEHMDEGEIIIHGNTGSGLGCEMIGGRIYVHGNVDSFLGEDMKDGEVHVFGDVQGEFWNEGGTLYLHGNFEPLTDGDKEFISGTIYHKGKLICDKGVFIDETTS